MSSYPPFPEPGPTPPDASDPTYDPLPGPVPSGIPDLYPDDGPQLSPAPAFPPPEEGLEIPEAPEAGEPYEVEPPEIAE